MGDTRSMHERMRYDAIVKGETPELARRKLLLSLCTFDDDKAMGSQRRVAMLDFVAEIERMLSDTANVVPTLPTSTAEQKRELMMLANMIEVINMRIANWNMLTTERGAANMRSIREGAVTTAKKKVTEAMEALADAEDALALIDEDIANASIQQSLHARMRTALQTRKKLVENTKTIIRVMGLAEKLKRFEGDNNGETSG